MHIPQNHLQMAKVERALRFAAGSSEAGIIEKTLKTTTELQAALRARGITLIEPFTGTSVEFFTVLGPSEAYYTELVKEFEDADAIQKVAASNSEYLLESTVKDVLEEKFALEAALLDKPQTTPENNSSVILGTQYGSDKFIFTSDAGVPALKLAATEYPTIGNCYWMQIPHHGSRRNITAALIEYFSPKVAFVSAVGDKKHPRPAVVNAFKKIGARVYSTHYPHPANLRSKLGTVPDRAGYGPAIPLYEDPDKSKAA